MRVLSRNSFATARASSQTSVRPPKRRGISLSREKSTDREVCATDRVASSPRVGEEGRERRRLAEQFIIYDVDRQQWQHNRQAQARQCKQRVDPPPPQSLHVSTVDEKENLQFDSAMSLNLERRLPDPPRDRNRAREVRSRINEIEQRISYLLRNTQVR